MATKIYTKTGDKGDTALLGGRKVSKAHLRIEAYGTVDELNAYTGLCRDLLLQKTAFADPVLQQVQNMLFVAGSLLACDPDKDLKMALPAIEEHHVLLLERRIDEMEASLPALKQFILPGGNPIVSHLHVARCICRRAERNCVRLQEASTVAPMIIQYLNRLSDYFFVLARYIAKEFDAPEVIWVPEK